MNDEKKKDMNRKLVVAAVIAFAPELICQIIILELLQKGIIGITVALLLTIVAIGAVFAMIVVLLKELMLPIKAAMSGEDINQSDSKIAQKTQKMAARQDELGEIVRTVQSTFGGFTHTIAMIKQATEELSAVSEEFSQTFDSMEQVVMNTSTAVGTITSNTSVQAEKTLDIKTKTDSIAVAIDHILENVNALTASAQAVSECNQSATQIIEELIRISNDNGESIEAVRDQTEKTNQSVQEIRTVTEIIAGISNQTNLLALNASIEAARAGEHGKGFAVVADEIRKLAEQSRESASQITGIIEMLIRNSNTTVDTMKKVTDMIDKQGEELSQTKSVFGDLNNEIGLVGGAVDNIRNEIEQLNQLKNSVMGAVDNLAAIAEENAASTQETSASMQELGNLVAECRRDVEEIVRMSETLAENTNKFTLQFSSEE